MAAAAALQAQPVVVGRSAQEHLLYIQEKVNPILEALVTAVLLERPEDPVAFMLKWLSEQTKSDDAAQQRISSPPEDVTKEIEAIKAEIAKLTARKKELMDKMESGEIQIEEAAEEPPEEEEEEESEDDDDDDVTEDLGPPKGWKPGQRTSISAEAYGDWNRKTVFVPPVYEKTPEQMTRIKNVLGQSFLFNGLDGKNMDVVCLAMKEKVVEAGTRLIQQGDDGDALYIIEEGKVDCFKTIQGEEKLVKTCIPGDAFGELALLYNCPRAASVHSTEKTVLWELDRDSFNGIVKQAAMNKRDKYMDFLKKVPIFKNIEAYDMMTLADTAKECSYQNGQAIIREGDPGNEFFIVVEGECVAKKGLLTVHSHKVGDYFGELALSRNAPRAASVFASSDNVMLLSLDRKTFNRLLGPLQEILRREAKRYEQ